MNFAGTVSIQEKENLFIFNLSGKFVGEEETEKLKLELESKAKLPKNRVIIDFKEVTYFSSLALGILVKEDENYTINDGKIVICSVPSFLENIFNLTKLSSILHIIPTLEEAEIEVLK